MKTLPISRALLALVFCGAGLMHFRATETYVKIMPPYLPYPKTLVWLSGAAEIVSGLGVLPRPTRKWAGMGLIALLVAVFPANIHMALHGTKDVGITVPQWVWWTRLPFQALFIAWVWFAAIDKRAR
jgi:uncharacterized membrane protein